MVENLMAKGAVPFPINGTTRLLIKRRTEQLAPDGSSITVILIWYQSFFVTEGWRTMGPAVAEMYAPPSIQIDERDFPAFLKILNGWEKLRGMV